MLKKSSKLVKSFNYCIKFCFIFKKNKWYKNSVPFPCKKGVLYLKCCLICKTMFMCNNFHEDKFIDKFHLNFKNL